MTPSDLTARLTEIRDELNRDIEFDLAAADGGDTYCGKRAAKAVRQREAIDAAITALGEREKMVAIPEGWRLVPFRITLEMRNAVVDAAFARGRSDQELDWQVALSAAPSPPKGKGDGGYRMANWNGITPIGEPQPLDHADD